MLLSVDSKGVVIKYKRPILIRMSLYLFWGRSNAAFLPFCSPRDGDLRALLGEFFFRHELAVSVVAGQSGFGVVPLFVFGGNRFGVRRAGQADAAKLACECRGHFCLLCRRNSAAG